MEESRYDIAIVGLGPAGSTLARLLSPKFSVAVIDQKGEEGSFFQKPCGGLLAPDAQKAFAKFGLTLPKELLVDPQIFSVRTIDLDGSQTRHYQRFYVNIHRQKLDCFLKGLLPASVDRFDPARCCRIEREKEGFSLTVDLTDKQETIQIKSRWVVGADGANSLVRRCFFPKKRIRSYVAIQQWFSETHAHPFYSCVFDQKRTDCYSWSVSKDGCFIFGGAYPARGCRDRFEAQKKALEKQGFHFGVPLKTEGCLVLRPAAPWQFCCGGAGVFLIGEAAGFISPSSLEGISSSITSAALLAQVLNSGCADPERVYRRKTFPLRLKLSGKLLKSPFMYHPFLRNLVMKSGLGSIRVLSQTEGESKQKIV